MAIGERIRFIRNLRGMTQKYLGIMAGLPERTADIRMAQYEAGTRTPKEDLTKALAHALDVSPDALTVPDIDTYIGLMHTLCSRAEKQEIFWMSFRVGAKCVKNTARAKSARTIMTNGAIIIRSTIRPGIG